jgi:putative tricarboxylic transport membrane protein
MKMDGRQMAKADFISSILLISISLFIMIYVLLDFPRFPEWGGLYSNPGFTPFLLGLTLLLMSLYLLMRSLKSQGQQIRTTMEAVNRFFRRQKVVRFLICLGLFVFFYVLLGRIPFIIDTALYLFLSFLIFGKGRWFVALMIAVAGSFTVYIVFSRVFLVPLP